MYPALHFIVPSLCIFFKLSHSHPILGKILFSFILPDDPVEADHQKASGIRWPGEHSLPLLSFLPLCFFLLLPYPSLLHFYLFFLPSLLPLFLVCLKCSPEIGPRIKEICSFSSTNFLADLEQVTSLSALSPHLEKKRLSL